MDKIGLWLPSREKLTRYYLEKPGIFLKEVRDKLVERLEQENGFEFIKGLDFRRAIIKNGEVFLDDFCFSDLDLFFWFGAIDVDLNSYHIEVLKTIKKKTIVVNDPNALFIGLDKFKSLDKLRDNGITVPDTVLLSDESIEDASNLLDEWGEALIKPRFGSYGVGMIRVKDKQTLIDTLDYANQNTHYLERFIPNDVNDWCGVNVINKKVIHGYGKKPEAISSWKIHDRKREGGKMVFKEPDSKQKKIALKVGEVTGLDFFGVDLIKDVNGRYYVVDVNTFPGLYPDIYEQAELDIFDEFVDCIKRKIDGKK